MMIKYLDRLPGLKPLLVVIVFAISGCQCVKTTEQWYPNYGLFRTSPPRKIVVYVHGYGGTDSSFGDIPYIGDMNKNNITPILFNYTTSLFGFNQDSIGVSANDFRVFLNDTLFNRLPVGIGQDKITVVCHSTGCPIVFNYITDNPFDHRVETIITIGGAHYGAEEAPILGKLKFLFNSLDDKKINELKYGSTTLSHMQFKLHHLLMRQARVETEQKALKDTAFPEFQYVVNKDVDQSYKNKKDEKTIKLPKVISVVGAENLLGKNYTDSDGVIRVESATPDCHLLSKAPKNIYDINKNYRRDNEDYPCDDKFILFLPSCDHTSFFSDSECLTPIAELIKYVTLKDDKKFAKNDDKKLAEEYKKVIGKPEIFKSFLTDLRMAALWIKVEVKDNASQKEIDTYKTEVFLCDNEHYEKWEPKYIRTSKFLPESIFYYRDFVAPQTLCLRVLHNDKSVNLRYISTENHRPVSEELKVRVKPLQNTMVWCRSYSTQNAGVKSDMDCETVN